ncbi:MAG: prepilin-type N-terminal cleavage/methylation domain-containing protein [Burkholderiales bacterium]|nr:prepilin-type N-terminal cleavage/methylation domain-containing protein [Burkholderiales bacterium]
MKRGEAGFTLIELVVAMALLGTMLVLLYSGLTFALRSWDAGDTNGRRTADRRIGENFLRREISELFPMRWKEPNIVKFAFEGEKDRMRFVSSRPAGIAQGGLSLVGIEVQEERGPERKRNLVMRRAMPDDEARSFGPLDAAEPTVLLAGVDSVSFEYFGAENDFTPPKWSDTWRIEVKVPEMIRVRIIAADGPQPDMTVRINLGEEAGCLENAFQRSCRPRRQ